MIDLGLDATQMEQYLEALVSSHRIEYEIAILDADEKHISSLTYPSAHLLAGEVSFDPEQDVRRWAGLTFLDPDHRLSFTPDSPKQGGVYANHFVDITYRVEVAAMKDWVDVPLFRGPLSKLTHEGQQVTIEAMSKEILCLAPHVLTETKTLKKGMNVRAAIEEALGYMGENKFEIPATDKKLERDIVFEPGSEVWRVVTGKTEEGEEDEESSGKEEDKKTNKEKTEGSGGLIALLGDESRLAFFDGRGKFVVRKRKSPVVVKFTDRHILTKPSLIYDTLEFRNWGKVTGAKAKGEKKPVSGVWALPPEHPLSPEALARNGKNRRMVVTGTSSAKTKAACEEKAKELVEDAGTSGLEASFESLVLPHLEDSDKAVVETPEEGSIGFRLGQFTIPLAADATMSVGFNKKVKVKRPRQRPSDGGGTAGGGRPRNGPRRGPRGTGW